MWLTNTCPAQNSVAEFQKALTDKASFTETDFHTLTQGRPVVKLLSARDRREVVVAGLAPLLATALAIGRGCDASLEEETP